MIDIPPRPIAAAWANGSRADSAAQGAVTGAGLNREIWCSEAEVGVHNRMATSVDVYAQILGAGQFGLTSERGEARQVKCER